VTADEPQVAALERFLRVVLRLRGNDPNLVFWQLGDFVDLWRIGNDGDSVNDRMKDLLDDRGALVELLQALCPAGLRTRVLAGNHDEDLEEFEWHLSTEEMVGVTNGSGAHTLVLHGHQFDPVERLPQEIKAFFARGATERVPPAALTMLEATNPHWKPEPIDAPLPKKPRQAWKLLHADLTAVDPVPLGAAAVNVLEHTPTDDPAARFREMLGAPGSKLSADPPSQTFFSDAAWHSDGYDARGHDIRLVVIGHTHRPRIVRGKRANGKRFVLMDCGAWVGTGFLSRALGAPIRRSQIGVRVGDDVRVYQIEYRAAV
jgi:UDP-2,3-diacylglucosamine pyrophosphatase LpxH